MTDLPDELLLTYHDRHLAPLDGDLPEEGREYLRRRWLRDVRANPEAIRQLAEWAETEGWPDA